MGEAYQGDYGLWLGHIQYIPDRAIIDKADLIVGLLATQRIGLECILCMHMVRLGAVC